jgi:energy-coupling factor transporter ATP-binding protein EcfA2
MSAQQQPAAGRQAGPGAPTVKDLILVCGANGIGKSTACRALVASLPHSAYVDSDWCRCMNPFAFSPETIDLIVANIAGLMGNYFRCRTVEHVIFSYGFHGPRRQIFDRILAALADDGVCYRFCPVTLYCEAGENVHRMQADGRDAARIERALEAREIYARLPYPTVDVSHLSVDETVAAMLDTLASAYGVPQTIPGFPVCS